MNTHKLHEHDPSERSAKSDFVKGMLCGNDPSEWSTMSDFKKKTKKKKSEDSEDPEGSSEETTVVIKTTPEKLADAQRVMAEEVFNLNEIPASLGQLSAAALFLQMIQAFLLVLLALTSDSKWYWYVSYPDPDDGVDGFQPTPRQVSTFPLPWLTFLVPLLSGLEHMSCIVFRESYEYYIARNQNPFRWTEYTMSASLMKVIIAQECGITDLHLLICIFVLMAISVQAAATHENVNAKARSENRAQNWRPFFVGWIGHLTNWGIMYNYLSVYNRDGGDLGPVIWLVIWMFLLDTSFAVTFTLQWAQIGPYKNYVLGEKTFILLSFTSKTVLIWISAINSTHTRN